MTTTDTPYLVSPSRVIRIIILVHTQTAHMRAVHVIPEHETKWRLEMAACPGLVTEVGADQLGRVAREGARELAGSFGEDVLAHCLI